MRVIVVGAGIDGLSTAWAATKAGHEVTLLEQGEGFPHLKAASGDHHRIIRRAYGKASGYGRAITEAYDAWDELWADIGRSHLDPRGFLCVSRQEGDDTDAMRDGLAEGGYPFETLSAEETKERYPFFDPASIRYAIFSEEGGVLHCRKIAADLADWLKANGATLRDNTRVTAVDAEAGSVTMASGETLTADRVVVTAGAWVLKLFPELSETLATYRTAVVYLDPPADLAEAWANAPTILDVGGDTDGYIVPPSGGAGLKFGSGLHKRPTDDADANREPEAGEGEAVRDLFAPPIARIGEYRVSDVWTCAYTFTEDERFFARRTGKCLVVSACSGHGYKFGAAVGRRVGRWIGEGDDAALLRWLRAEEQAGAPSL